MYIKAEFTCPGYYQTIQAGYKTGLCAPLHGKKTDALASTVGRSPASIIPWLSRQQLVHRYAQSAARNSDEQNRMALRSYKSIIGRFSRFTTFHGIAKILSDKSPRLGRGRVPVLTAMSLTISVVQCYSLSGSSQSTFHCKLNKLVAFNKYLKWIISYFQL